MTCYLTDATDPDEVARGYRGGRVRGGQALPGACDDAIRRIGVTDIDRIMPVLERMAGLGMPLLIHGEVTDPEVDMFDREAVFIERVLRPAAPPAARTAHRARAHHDRGGGRLRRDAAARIWRRRSPRIICHQPQRDLRRAASGRISIACRSPSARSTAAPCAAPRPPATQRSFSAPTARRTRLPTKETACGCAGIFTAPCALEIYAEVFEEEGALDRFEAFASLNGPAFYRLPANEARVTLAPRGLDRAGADRRGRPRRRRRSAPARPCAGGWSDEPSAAVD